MNFISYAQNFEDIMLWRALKHVKNGFYIDVGANHPEEDSVTKGFYEHGWSGINIEPEREFYELLKDDRPKDINVNIAIADNVNSIDFFVSNVRGWSTTDGGGSNNLKGKNAFSEVRKVPAISLDKLFEQHKVKEVHFLKIDVEGAEKDVLESISFKEIRPWIIVVEATKPMTQIDVSSEWEYILFENNYVFGYFDGINKFYIDEKHLELLSAFQHPPNIFDEFKLITEIQAQSRAVHAESRAVHAEARAKQAEARAEQADVCDVDTRLMLVYSSWSWRITTPLRWCGLQARRIWQYGLLLRVKKLVKKVAYLILRFGINLLDIFPNFRRLCIISAEKLGLYDRIHSIYLRISGRAPVIQKAYLTPECISHLTPESGNDLCLHAQQLYVELKDLLVEERQENADANRD